MGAKSSRLFTFHCVPIEVIALRYVCMFVPLRRKLPQKKLIYLFIITFDDRSSMGPLAAVIADAQTDYLMLKR